MLFITAMQWRPFFARSFYFNYGVAKETKLQGNREMAPLVCGESDCWVSNIHMLDNEINPNNFCSMNCRAIKLIIFLFYISFEKWIHKLGTYSIMSRM